MNVLEQRQAEAYNSMQTAVQKLRRTMNTQRTLYEIEVALAHYNSFDFRRNIVAFNVNGWSGTLPIFHECDMLVCTKSGYLTEIEIKRTWSDFVADFKKKHKHENNGLMKYFYYCLPASFDLKETYVLLEEHKVNYSGILFYDEYLNFQFHGFRVSQDDYQNRCLKGHKKLTIEQQLEVARLGAMRVIGLKEKLITKGQ